MSPQKVPGLGQRAGQWERRATTPYRQHSYATLGRDAKTDRKALSSRIGHSDVTFTTKQCVQTDLEVV